VQTWKPRHSAFQGSTTAKAQTHPSLTVKTFVPSVPHITFGASVMIGPSCSFGGAFGTRYGESSWFSRMTRRTRLRETRTPRTTRKARPDLAMALALERRRRQVVPDVDQKLLVGQLRLRTTLRHGQGFHSTARA